MVVFASYLSTLNKSFMRKPSLVHIIFEYQCLANPPFEYTDIVTFNVERWNQNTKFISLIEDKENQKSVHLYLGTYIKKNRNLTKQIVYLLKHTHYRFVA